MCKDYLSSGPLESQQKKESLRDTRREKRSLLSWIIEKNESQKSGGPMTAKTHCGSFWEVAKKERAPWPTREGGL